MSWRVPSDDRNATRSESLDQETSGSRDAEPHHEGAPSTKRSLQHSQKTEPGLSTTKEALPCSRSIRPSVLAAPIARKRSSGENASTLGGAPSALLESATRSSGGAGSMRATYASSRVVKANQ